MLWDALGCFGMLWDAVRFSGDRDVAEGHSVILQGFLKDAFGFSEILQDSLGFFKISEDSLKFTGIL